MSGRNQLYALVSVAVLTCGVAGCATVGTYAKCGAGGCPGDTTITADVRALLDRYPALEAPNLIRVQTLDHVVYLSGLVDTPLERQMAEAVALRATGVVRVVNSIAVNNKG